MMKKIPILLMTLMGAFLSDFSVARASENQINLELTNGESVVFLLEQTPKITYSDQAVTVTYSEGTLEYQMSEIKKLTLGETTADGVEDVKASTVLGSISCTGGAFHFEGFAKGSVISLYSVAGVKVQSASVQADGTQDVQVGNLPAGTYIFNVNGVTYKFNKR